MTTRQSKDTYQKGLARSRGSLWGRIRSVFGGRTTLDAGQVENLEEALISSDVGVEVSLQIVESLRREPALVDGVTEEELKDLLAGRIVEAMKPYSGDDPIAVDPGRLPHVVLVTGVNGTGKTTTIGKLAARSVAGGRRVLLVAADTYRAAAVNQLGVWAERSGAGIVRGNEGGDPAAVVHDGLTRAVSIGSDLVLIDTAGRLHTKEPLMKELGKIRRVASGIVEGAPQRVLLVLDATTGQNALAQARIFRESAGVTDLVITKLDGSARGGFLLPVTRELRTPVSYVGMGEGIDDLVPFDPVQYARQLVGL